MKETFLVLSLHNKLRSKVQPPAANMQKLVSPPPQVPSRLGSPIHLPPHAQGGGQPTGATQ